MRRIIAVVLSCLLASPAWAGTTYYVVTGGGVNTTGPATSCTNTVANPDVYNTVQYAINGDTVVIGPGNPCPTWTVGINNYATAGSGQAITITGSGTPGGACGTDNSGNTIAGTCGAATSGGTTIILGDIGGASAVDIHESTAGHAVVSNTTFVMNNGFALPTNVIENGSPVGGGMPVILHHLTFLNNRDGAALPNHEGKTAISMGALRGVIYRNIFRGDSSTGTNARGGIRCKYAPSAVAYWNRTPTYGTADTNGDINLYIETNKFEHFEEAIDIDDGCKAVLRRNDVTNSLFPFHGHDTSERGARHWEVYNNIFRCVAPVTLSGGPWVQARGGTGVNTDNVYSLLTTTCAVSGDVALSATIQVLYRLAAGGCYAGPYPWYPQLGWGYDGTHTLDTNGNDQQREAAYIWNNTTTIGGPEVNNFVIANHAGDGCTPTQLETDYMVENRDYYLGGAGKPGYTKYQYPHVLATSIGTVITTPAGLGGGVKLGGGVTIP